MLSDYSVEVMERHAFTTPQPKDQELGEGSILFFHLCISIHTKIFIVVNLIICD